MANLHFTHRCQNRFPIPESELGLRPIYHQKERRADGHLFISVIAYQVIQALRQKMKETGENASWNTVRDILRHRPRITTTFERKDGKTLHVRTIATPDEDQAAHYHAMGIKPPGRNSRKTVV